MNQSIQLHPEDNVRVAFRNFEVGEQIDGIRIQSFIPKGHKFAMVDIELNQPIIKYGNPIGAASKPISQGGHVHVHNVHTLLDAKLEYQYQPQAHFLASEKPKKTFLGYRRANHQVGIRNELWLIPTVGCINALVRKFVDTYPKENTNHPSIDGIYAYTHPFGCSQMGDDLQNTKETLQNISLHPNAGGVIILGLGCENNQVKAFRETYSYDPNRVKFVVLQEITNDREVIHQLMDELLEQMKQDTRSVCGIEDLAIGLKCGGSDAFSGITANPLTGRLSDYIITHGGTTVLTEVPEMFGAEHLLMQRACDSSVFEHTVSLINDFKDYYEAHHQVIYDNPSPGNKDGGITTLEEKSLGCIQKGGTAVVQDVLAHTERLKKKGLNLIQAPGNDLVSVTTLGMCGCQMVIFTTGRGTPFGGFIPTIKVASNTELAKRKPDWIDFDSGQLMSSEQPDQILDDFIDVVVAIASGQKTQNEMNDFREIAIFKDGVML